MVTPCLVALALAASAGPTALEGGGVRATLDLAGFKEDLGPGAIRGAYYRLGQWSIDPASDRGRGLGRSLVVSALVDAVPPGVDLARLRAHVLADRSPAPEVTETASPPGFWFTGTTLIAQGYAQWHLWFHTLAGDRWVELHFSSVGPGKADPRAVERLALEIARSLKVERR